MEQELWIGFYKVKSPKQGIGYPEAVEEALCFGWIDGIRKRLDEHSYCQRFTPRRKNSYWSQVNTRKFEELQQQGLVTPAGLKAFEKGGKETNDYSFEQNQVTLSEEQLRVLKANKKAWKFWNAQPQGYRKRASWWVLSAKQESTRNKRLKELIDDAANGLRINLLRR